MSLLMHQVHTGRAPSYLHNCVSASADITSRPRLRSTSSRRYERQRTHLKFGERSFACAGPRAWNSLPSSLHELTGTKAFKRQLETFFQQAYNSRRNISLLCLGLYFTLYNFVLFLRILTFNYYFFLLGLSLFV